MQEDLSGLAALGRLQELSLTGPAAPPCRVSAALAAGLAPLTQLKALTLKLQACPFTMLRPDLPAVLLGALVSAAAPLRSLPSRLADAAAAVTSDEHVVLRKTRLFHVVHRRLSRPSTVEGGLSQQHRTS